MIDDLLVYKPNDHFFVMPDKKLTDVCKVPKNIGGVFVVFKLAEGRVDLVYVGASKIKTDKFRSKLENDLYTEIVDGIQFGGKRKDTWIAKLKDEGIDALDVYWFATFGKGNQDLPSYVQATFLQNFFDQNGCLPEWNHSF